MDELSQNVQNTKVSLVASSRELQEVEKRAESSINQDLDGMRRTLLNGYSKMQHLCEQTDLFLFQIKLQDNAQELVDLKPQLLWLNTYVDQIAENLEVAQQKATFALTTATDFDYKIMDISQKTEVNRSRLEDAQRTGQIMANAARSQLDSSERALTSAKKDLAAKNHEIQSKRRDADAKRIRKNEMESDVSEKNRKIEQVRRKAASKKDKAAVSAIVGGLGVLFAPVTFGASLAVTAGSVGVGIAQAVDASDLIDEANNERTRVSAIQTEISGVESDLRNLEQQENGLQISVRNLKSQVKSQESNQRQYQSKLREAKGAQGEISVLEVRASTLANDINSKRRNVRNVKEYLENCSTMLKEKSVEVNSQSTAIEWLHGRTYRRKQAFNRQKALMAKVTDELAKIQVELPMLLYDEGLNLLGYEPGETAQHAVIEIGPSIPDLCCYAKDPVMAIPGGWGDDE